MINIFKDQQNILYVCPTRFAGTRERMIIRDCVLLKEVGHNIFLYCLKDSFLDHECQKNSIATIYHTGKETTSLFKWHKLNRLKKFIKSVDVNIVHCYELNFLWPVSFFLRKKKLTPLFFTLTNEVSKYYQQIWYKPLLSRLDMVFIPVREMIESVTTKLDIPARKIYPSGLGLKKKFINEPKTEFDTGVWNFGCWINDDEENEKELAICFEALWAVNSSYRLKKLANIHLYTSRTWNSFILFDKLKEIIKKYDIEKYVHFHEKVKVTEISADVWISYNSKLPLEDYTLISMLKGIPTIMPRNATTSDICRFYGDMNLNFKAGDSRELRNSMEMLTSKILKGEVAMAKSKDELWLEHGEEGYKYNLYKIYEKQLNKRRRFYS